jgi:hypothetical protein
MGQSSSNNKNIKLFGLELLHLQYRHSLKGQCSDSSHGTKPSEGSAVPADNNTDNINMAGAIYVSISQDTKASWGQCSAIS